MVDARTRLGSRTYLALTLALCVLAPACQTAMSIEEAKKVAAAFNGESFSPPPRTINDITDYLRKRTDPSDISWQPPNTTDRDALAQFYLRRGLAFGFLGTADQELADLTAALKYAHIGGSPPLHEVLHEVALAERRAGNFTRFVDYIRQAIAASPAVAPRVTNMSTLAMSYVAFGDVKAAETALAAAAWLFYGTLDGRRLDGSPADIMVAHAIFAQAQAALLEVKGKHAEAEALYRQAEALCDAQPSDFARRPAFDHIGRVSCARRLTLHSELVRTLIRQGRLVEAENAARQALFSTPYSAVNASTLRSLSGVLLEQGRYRESEMLARAAVDLYRRVRAAPGSLEVALARAQLAMAFGAQGAYREALAEHDAIRASLSGDREFQERLFAAGVFGGHFAMSYAEVLLRTGHVDRALEILGPELERSKRLVGEVHRSTGEIRGYLAQVYAAKGDAARALREFRAAMPLLLTRPHAIDADATGRRAADQRLVGILSAYIGFLADIRGAALERETGLDAAAEAFRLADVARGRSVQRALDASAVRAAVQSKDLADLVRIQQDATRQIGALSTLASDDRQDSQTVADLRIRISALQRAVETLTARIEKEFPAYAELLDPKPLMLEEARAMLGPDEGLITILVARDRSFVWAVSAVGPVAFASAAIGTHEMEKTVATLRKALDPSAKILGDIPALDLAEAHHLYRALLEPVRSGWQHARRLVVVTNGPLGQLPIAILPTKPVMLPPESDVMFSNYRQVPWLVRSHAVTMLPSVASLATLRALPSGEPSRRSFVGFGDPYFSREQADLANQEPTPSAGRELGTVGAAGESGPTATVALATRGIPVTFRSSPQAFDSSRLAQLPRLPDTAEEIRSLARAMNADPEHDVFLGARANEKSVKSLDLANYRVVAFATHGLTPGDLDGLTQPALALSAPDTAGAEGDGLLTMDEILALRMDADWIVLSACNTASGQGAGSDAVSGLGRAFFYAGARALLVSNWPVETTSARALTTDLFRRQQSGPGVTRAQALQETMNWLIDQGTFVDAKSGKVIFSYAHPIFWAPFTLIGDGGAAVSGR